MKEAYFFDMDGVLFDSMPHHAIAWEKVMEQHNLPFSTYDCYVNEGRTGESVIREAMWKARGRDATPDEISSIYAEKSSYFTMLEQKAGGTPTIPGVAEVLQYIHTCGNDIWVVTGSGMRSLIDNLNKVLPAVFAKERMEYLSRPYEERQKEKALKKQQKDQVFSISSHININRP